jgi:hypothetical protein
MFCENILVRLVDILDCDDSQVAVITEIAQGNAGSRLHALAVYRLLRHIECDGHAEKVAIGEAAVGDDTGHLVRFKVRAASSSNLPIIVFLTQET